MIHFIVCEPTLSADSFEGMCDMALHIGYGTEKMSKEEKIDHENDFFESLLFLSEKFQKEFIVLCCIENISLVDNKRMVFIVDMLKRRETSTYKPCHKIYFQRGENRFECLYSFDNKLEDIIL